MFNYLKHAMMVAMLSSIAINAFAETGAPVYDADNPPPSFDGQPYDSGRGASSPQPHTPSLNLTMEQRIDRLEQQLDNLQHSDGSTKLNHLQSELQSLRGQTDELTHQLQILQNQQKSMYSDLDQRINKQQSSSKASPPPVANEDDDAVVQRPAVKPKKPVSMSKPALPTPPVDAPSAPAPSSSNMTIEASNNTQPDVAEEQQTYQVAYDLIKSKKYNEAVAALKKMLQKYPSGQFAANAHYWLGELYGLMGKNDESATEFSNVVSAYPNSPKVSDAQLKLGLIYAAQFKWAEAKAVFKKVISHYPKTASARLASEQLKQIKQAGH